jgi:hypothetical protein
MRITLMHNPKAGDAEHGRKELMAALAKAGHHATYQSTKKKDYKKALENPTDLVLAAGGGRLQPKMVSLILYVRATSIVRFLWSISKRGWQEKSTNFRCPFEGSVNYKLFGEDRHFTSMTNLGHGKSKSRKARAKSKLQSNHLR